MAGVASPQLPPSPEQLQTVRRRTTLLRTAIAVLIVLTWLAIWNATVWLHNKYGPLPAILAMPIAAIGYAAHFRLSAFALMGRFILTQAEGRTFRADDELNGMLLSGFISYGVLAALPVTAALGWWS